MGWVSRNQQGHWMPQSLQRSSKASRPDFSSGVKLDTTIPGDCSSSTRGCFTIQISALTLGLWSWLFSSGEPPPPISYSSLLLPRTEPRSTGAVVLADLELHFLPTCATLCAVLGGGVRARQSRTLGTLLKQVGLELMAFFLPHLPKLGPQTIPHVSIYLFGFCIFVCLFLA